MTLGNIHGKGCWEYRSTDGQQGPGRITDVLYFDPVGRIAISVGEETVIFRHELGNHGNAGQELTLLQTFHA